MGTHLTDPSLQTKYSLCTVNWKPSLTPAPTLMIKKLTFKEPVRGVVGVRLVGGTVVIKGDTTYTDDTGYLVNIDLPCLQTPNYIDGHVSNYLGVLWNKTINSSLETPTVSRSCTTSQPAIHCAPLSQGLIVSALNVTISSMLTDSVIVVPPMCEAYFSVVLEFVIKLSDTQ